MEASAAPPQAVQPALLSWKLYREMAASGLGGARTAWCKQTWGMTRTGAPLCLHGLHARPHGHSCAVATG